MAHIERKKINGRIYLYLYQSYRDKTGRVKKKMIKYLGPEAKSKHPNLQSEKEHNPQK